MEENARPPLRIVHSVESTWASSYEFWNRRTIAEIIESLVPSARSPLLVKADGTIMQGNTRVFILQERGFDPDSLPRTLFTSIQIDEV